MFKALLTAIALSLAGTVASAADIEITQLPTPADKAGIKNWQAGAMKVKNIDVDIAYLRLKREFDFSTLEERLQNSPGLFGYESLLKQSGFMHEVQSGLYYRMRDELRSGVFVDITIEKDREGIRIDYGYNTSRVGNQAAYQEQFLSRIAKALSS